MKSISIGEKIAFEEDLNTGSRYVNAYISDIKENTKSITLTINVTYTFEYMDLEQTFEYTQTINKTDLKELVAMDEWTIDFKPDQQNGKFISCNLNPKNENDIFKILEYSADTIAFGINVEWSDIIKGANITKELLEIVSKATHKSYDTVDIKEILEVAADNNIIQDNCYLHISDYESFDEIDTKLAKVILSKLQKYVTDIYEPNDEGTDDIWDELQIEFYRTLG